MDFFSNEVGNTIPWFGVTHFVIMFVFTISLILLWWFAPKIKKSKHEKLFRFALVGLVLLFEWNVFQSRILTGSVFRMPLCAVSLYGLTFSIMFRNEKSFKIFYFYAFGTFLTFLFFDTVWGLDRWSGWKFFGAHATIGWLAVYGVAVLGYRPNKTDLIKSTTYLAIYAFISGFAFSRYGGSDELFLFHPPLVEVQFIIDIHVILYQIIFCTLAVFLLYLMYVPIQISDKLKKNT